MLSADIKKRLGAFDLEASLRADASSTLVLVGESGAGKSTVLNLLAGLVHPDSGIIALDGEVYFDSQRRIAVPAHARPVAYVFQEYALFPHLSVFGNVAFGLRAQGIAEAEVRQRVMDMLAQLGIAELRSERPHRLSGGQQQRVALARALVLQPKLLLLDEPLSALDLQTRREVRAELRRVVAALPCVTLFVTHSRFEAMALGDRIAVVDEGRIVQMGSRDDLLRHPRSRYVAELMGVNFFQGRVVSADASGLAEIETSNGTLHVVDVTVGEDIFMTVDPRDITLHTTRPTGSAQNVLSGTIVELVPEPPFGEHVRVILDTHPPLVAEITAHARQTLGLRQGIPIYASFKALAARAYR